MPVRVLCLHGAQQTRDIFQNQLSRFEDDLVDIAELVYLEAPHVLPLITAQDDVPTRSWCSTDGKNDYSAGDAAVATAMQPAGAGTDLAFSVMLGFSQGALMIYRYLLLHAEDAAVTEQLRGVIVAGAPDPRCVFPRSGHSALYQSTGSAASSGTGDAFFGALPFLHIIGKKDGVVSPEESSAFAHVCSSASQILFHDHAHSIPVLKGVRAAVREVCQVASMSPTHLTEALEAREEELEMVRTMYDEECVVTRGTEALVRIPLFSDVFQLSLISSSAAESLDASTVHALERIKLCFRVPRSYPSSLPIIEIADGPSWHSVKYQRWAADMVLRTSAYIADELGVGTAMLLPAYLYAIELAQEGINTLVEVFAEGARGSGGGAHSVPESGTDEEVAARELRGLWATEDELFRETYIAEAESRAAELLSAETKRARAHFQSTADSAEDDDTVPYHEASDFDTSTVAPGSGGSCTLTIGLIGKPSAGKSTFFNAITNPVDEGDAARVAAFPFTTIEPNFGSGFAPLYCPCATLRASRAVCEARGGSTKAMAEGCNEASSSAVVSSELTGDLCDATYGHIRALGSVLFRRQPVRVKDVAGLVQGAYQGKGKGNQFLNDLCDADVLVHVVDGAAATEADGAACTPGQGSTMEDITWVRAEVHSWIYDNLRAKWPSIVRQPLKLRTMFSGYRSTPTFVDRVLRRIGIRNQAALTAVLRTWGPQELHVFVALYIRLRFPMVVALNKADLPSAADMAASLRQAHPHEVFLSMAARVEWLALQLKRRGYVDYTPGATSLNVKAGDDEISRLDKGVQQQLQDVVSFFSATPPQQSQLSPVFVTTGVQDVLAAAMEACRVMIVYPVRTFDPFTSLAHCLTFKPGSSAERVFNALVHLKLLEGKLVRFEMIDLTPAKQQLLQQLLVSPSTVYSQDASTPAPAQPYPFTQLTSVRTLRKTEVISSSVVLARVLSNKRQLA